jgi:hypothetical protein
VACSTMEMIRCTAARSPAGTALAARSKFRSTW